MYARRSADLHSELREIYDFMVILPRVEASSPIKQTANQDTRLCISGQESCVMHKCVIYGNQ